MYDPSIGRFLQRDPFAGLIASPLSLHRYTYVENNPVNALDLSGLASSKVLQDRFESDCFMLNQEGSGYYVNASCTGMQVLGQAGQYALVWQGWTPRIVVIRPATSPPGGGGGGGESGGNDSGKRIPERQAPDYNDLARRLGFRRTNFRSHGQPVYRRGNRYITPDVDSHSGGIWKMADSPENLRSKQTRMGTYDADLNRIGD